VPIYDYVCTACGTRVEVMHGVNESGPTLCNGCGGPMRKALSPPAIVFKGSGWAKKERAGAAAKGDAGAGEKAGDAKGADGKGEGAKATGAKATGASNSPAAGPESAGKGGSGKD